MDPLTLTDTKADNGAENRLNVTPTRQNSTGGYSLDDSKLSTDLQKVSNADLTTTDACDEPMDIAERIQSELYKDTESQKWLYTSVHIKYKESSQWYQANFFHLHHNALDAIKVAFSNKKYIMSKDKVELEDDIVVEKISDLPNRKHHYVGKVIRSKDIIRFFFDKHTQPFYIPIDMSHLSGKACLLRFTFSPSESFDAQWDEIIRLKKNEHNYIEKDNRWTKHTLPEKAWISVLPVPECDDVVYFDRYNYDQQSLQGIGVIVTKTHSYWTFSCFAKTKMVQDFVEKFELEKITF